MVYDLQLQNSSTGLRLFWDDFPKNLSETWTHPPTHVHSKLGFIFIYFYFANPLTTSQYLLHVDTAKNFRKCKKKKKL